MGRADYYLHGSSNVICDICGWKFKRGELKETWDKLKVCPKDFEPRHPQDFVRGQKDDQSVPWSRPESSDTFVSASCTTRTAVVGEAVVGCSIIGTDNINGI